MASLPDRDGRFQARPVEWSVTETGPNKLVTFICRYLMTAWFDDSTGQWDTDWEQYAQEITGYHYIEKRDGNPNQSTIDQLVEALQWDGADLELLQRADWSKLTVGLTLGYEEYNGKTRLKVQWLHTPEGGGGGPKIEKSDDSTLATLQGRLGGKLRAISGAKPVGNSKPSGKPKPPSKPRTNPVAAASAAEVSEDDIPF